MKGRVRQRTTRRRKKGDDAHPFDTPESMEAYFEQTKNKAGRLACVFGTPVDDHDACEWCQRYAVIQEFELVSKIRGQIGAERWYFEDFIKGWAESRSRAET